MIMTMAWYTHKHKELEEKRKTIQQLKEILNSNVKMDANGNRFLGSEIM